MWITLAATCCLFRDQMHLQTVDTCSQWLPHFLLIICHSCIQKFHQHYHGDCRILADGMRIFNLECCYCFTTVLDRRSQPSYPQHSHRTYLHYLLLDIHQPHTMPVVWRNIIWMSCYSTEHSFHPTAIISRWQLQEWFWHCWFTNSFTENPSHTPCFYPRTCILQPSTHYTLQYSYHDTSQFTTNSYQTGALLLILQLRYWPFLRQHSSMFRQLRWRGRRFSNSTNGWQALDIRGSTWKNFLHTWKWITTQFMPIFMPLWEQWHCFIHG